MAKRFWLFLVIAGSLGLAVTTVAVVGPEPAAPTTHLQFEKTKLEAASKSYGEAFNSFGNANFAGVELAYRWSTRWLEAERQLSTRTDDWIAACRAHRDRMWELQESINDQFNKHMITIDQVYATDYYVAEAEAWLLQAKENSWEWKGPNRYSVRKE